MINLLPLWVWFSGLLVEYYSKNWLERASNRIGRTLCVDEATLVAARGKFARVYIKIDLSKPLKAWYRLKGKYLQLQYEALHDLCFICSQYGHRSTTCSLFMTQSQSGEGVDKSINNPLDGSINKQKASTKAQMEASEIEFGDWIKVVNGQDHRSTAVVLWLRNPHPYPTTRQSTVQANQLEQPTYRSTDYS